MTHKRRALAEVDPKLLAVIRDLLAGRAPWPLYLHGQAGRGKTCAALALLDHVRPPARQMYTTAADLTSAVMDSFNSRERFNYARYLPPARPDDTGGCLLCVLDELGTRDKISDTHYETTQKILDGREGYPLVVVSNHAIGTIGRIYDSRIASRCEAGTVYELTGRDRRTG